MTNEPAGQRPPIHMIEAEADALWDIALAARAQHPASAALLMIQGVSELVKSA